MVNVKRRGKNRKIPGIWKTVPVYLVQTENIFLETIKIIAQGLPF
jgi:hypothetical protein